jgi:hypothetical protein
MRRLALVIAVAISVPNAARAQACLGSVSFATAPVRLGGGAIFGDGYTAYAASLVAGKENGVFGDVGVMRIADDDFDDTEDQLFADLGYQLPIGARAQLCPMIGGALGTGPDDGGADVDSRFASAGLALGATFRPAPSVKLIPNGSLRFQYASSDVTPPGAATETLTDNYGVLGLGLGFIFFNDRLSIQPTVQLPFAADDNSASYGLTVSVGFAVRR